MTTISAEPLSPTLRLCAALLVGFTLLVWFLTDGFERWTFEDIRRERARQGDIAATTLHVRTAEDVARVFWTPDANESEVLIVDFIYTHCSTVCSALGSEFTQMQEALALTGERVRGRVKLVSISFDIDHETTASLSSYARLHRAKSGLWTIAVPASYAQSKNTLHELGVIAIPDGLGGFVHNGSIHVMTGTGRLLAIYDDADWKDALALAFDATRAPPIPHD